MPSNSVQFGTEPFTAATGTPEGVPDHAAMIEGRLIHLDTKNLKEWGVTAAAAKQILAGIPGIPIRACNNPDPHACDYSSDNFANVGYATGAKVVDGWIVAMAAITDRVAAQKINDKTWLPFGRGGWSVTGYPSNPTADFETSGLTNGFAPASIALIIGNGTPAFEGSGFEMVAAAISNHRGDNMPEDKTKGGGNDPVTYTQDALDKAIETALAAQKDEFEKQHTTIELAQNKINHDAQVGQLSEAERAAFDKKLAEMTPTKDVDAMITAAMIKTKDETLKAIEKEKLANTYCDMLTASVVLGAPLMSFGQIDQMKVAAKMESIKTMSVPAIQALIAEAELQVAAASPAQSAFDAMRIPGQAPGMNGDIELLADLNELSGRIS